MRRFDPTLSEDTFNAGKANQVWTEKTGFPQSAHLEGNVSVKPVGFAIIHVWTKTPLLKSGDPSRIKRRSYLVLILDCLHLAGLIHGNSQAEPGSLSSFARGDYGFYNAGS
jgi:hypothetical protein